MHSGSGAVLVLTDCGVEPTARRANEPLLSFPVQTLSPRNEPLFVDTDRGSEGKRRLSGIYELYFHHGARGTFQKPRKWRCKRKNLEVLSVCQPVWMGDGLKCNSSRAKAAWTPQWLDEETAGCDSEIISRFSFDWGETREEVRGKIVTHRNSSKLRELHCRAGLFWPPLFFLV